MYIKNNDKYVYHIKVLIDIIFDDCSLHIIGKNLLFSCKIPAILDCGIICQAYKRKLGHIHCLPSTVSKH